MEGISAKLATVGGRDKYVGVMQFLPMLLAEPAEGAGHKALADSLCALSAIAADTRTFTRFSLSFDAVWTSSRLQTLARMPASPWKFVALAQFFFDALFPPLEHLSYLVKRGVIANPKDRCGRMGNGAVLCWFWGLVCKILIASRDYYAESTCAAGAPNSSSSAMYRQTKLRKLRALLVKLVCYAFLAMSFLPAGGVRLLGANPSGPLMPLHYLFAAIAVPKFDVSNTVRGALGTTAALLEFYQ